jgi:hypothetical protein
VDPTPTTMTPVVRSTGQVPMHPPIGHNVNTENGTVRVVLALDLPAEWGNVNETAIHKAIVNGLVSHFGPVAGLQVLIGVDPDALVAFL